MSTVTELPKISKGRAFQLITHYFLSVVAQDYDCNETQIKK